jgi:Uma2 family endonuclease
MNSVPSSSAQQFSVADYLAWPNEERWELIDGVPYNMSPAPSIKHQNVVITIAAKLKNGLKGKPCKPFIAPVDVILSEHDVVQPDLLVVCKPEKIGEKAIHGAPDLVIEVLSPSTALKDMREKKALYERAGVREYVVIDPLENYLQRFFLGDDGRYASADVFGTDENLPLLSLPELILPLAEVFEQ